jgi:ArsR family transcriptional regulator, arsenate/arsenite/antimonite-responsive transcriptional repressor
MAKVFDMELFFQALADRTRLRLLNLMRDDEICVCFFVEVFDSNQPKISRHLAYLKKAGLVSARRDGKWMHYQITKPTDEHARKVLEDVLAWTASDKEMQKDRELLIKICSSPQPPVQIQGAPKPRRPVISTSGHAGTYY